MRKKIHRSSETGQFVSKTAADSNPATTISETVKSDGALKFLTKLAKDGGAIVSSNECSEAEIIVARACGRFHVDENHLGYVLRPAEWLERVTAKIDNDGQ